MLIVLPVIGMFVIFHVLYPICCQIQVSPKKKGIGSTVTPLTSLLIQINSFLMYDSCIVPMVQINTSHPYILTVLKRRVSFPKGEYSRGSRLSPLPMLDVMAGIKHGVYLNCGADGFRTRVQSVYSLELQRQYFQRTIYIKKWIFLSVSKRNTYL